MAGFSSGSSCRLSRLPCPALKRSIFPTKLTHCQNLLCPIAPKQLSVQQSALSEPLAQLLPLAAAAAAISARGARGAPAAPDAADGAASPDRAIKQLLYTLERAGRLVWPTLPPGEALEFSARLLAPLFKALSDDILRMDDIGERECDAIVGMCRPLVAGAPAALLAGVDGTGQQQGLEAGGLDVKALVRPSLGWLLFGGAGGLVSGAAGLHFSSSPTTPHPHSPCILPSPPHHRQPQLEDALQQRAWGLRKLAVILTLLEAKLLEIVSRWESGELRRAGLSRGEVERLVCAVFENTDHRAQCLQRIEVAEV